jgi:hypothetical protein
VADNVTTGVACLGLGKTDAPTNSQYTPGNLDHSGVRAQRLEEADLDLDGGVASSRRQARVDGAAGGRVEQRGQRTSLLRCVPQPLVIASPASLDTEPVRAAAVGSARSRARFRSSRLSPAPNVQSSKPPTLLRRKTDKKPVVAALVPKGSDVLRVEEVELAPLPGRTRR